MLEPGDGQDQLLKEDRVVVGPLLRSGDTHDLLVGVFVELPEHISCSHIRLSDTTEGLDLKTLRTVLKVVGNSVLSSCRRR